MNIIATYSHQPWNKGKLVGQKAPLPERYLGDPSETVNRRENPRSGTLRFSHRQQTASLRFNQAPCARRCSWRALVIASHRNAAENSSPSLVAESAVTKAQLANAAKQVDTNRKLELLDASHFILLCRLSDMSDSHLQALRRRRLRRGAFQTTALRSLSITPVHVESTCTVMSARIWLIGWRSTSISLLAL